MPTNEISHEDQLLSQMVSGDEVAQITQLIADGISKGGSVQVRTVHEEMESKIDYKHFANIVKACISTERIEGFRYGRGAIIFAKDSSVRFMPEDISFIREKCLALLEEKKAIQKEDVYEACMEEGFPSRDFDKGTFLVLLAKELNDRHIDGVIRKERGIVLDEPRMPPWLYGSENLKTLQEAPEPPQSTIIIEGTEYTVALFKENLTKLIIRVFEASESTDNDGNVQIDKKLYKVKNLDIMLRLLKNFYQA